MNNQSLVYGKRRKFDFLKKVMGMLSVFYIEMLVLIFVSCKVVKNKWLTRFLFVRKR